MNLCLQVFSLSISRRSVPRYPTNKIGLFLSKFEDFADRITKPHGRVEALCVTPQMGFSRSGNACTYKRIDAFPVNMIFVPSISRISCDCLIFIDSTMPHAMMNAKPEVIHRPPLILYLVPQRCIYSHPKELCTFTICFR